MNTMMRPYDRTRDYQAVSRFLIHTFKPGYRSTNWLEARWEYMHWHPAFNADEVGKCGLWENESGDVVALAHYEDSPGCVYFQIHPDYAHLKPAMFEHAEHSLYTINEEGQRFIRFFIDQRDGELQEIARSKGYETMDKTYEHMAEFVIPRPFPAISLPEGFRLQTLADENDLHKVNRVLWRGFNHPGEPPEDEIPGRKLMQSAPNFRKDLTVVVVAPDGNYVSFCGMWLDSVNKTAYVEPVATDPDYRRMGLGQAAVLEGIRRCGELGATVAYVGSGQPFYEALGFVRLFALYPWSKVF